jgi:hypothetical protein
MLFARFSHSFAFARYSSDFDMEVPMRLDVSLDRLGARSRYSGLRRSRPAGSGASLEFLALAQRRSRRTLPVTHLQVSAGTDFRRAVRGVNGA